MNLRTKVMLYFSVIGLISSLTTSLIIYLFASNMQVEALQTRLLSTVKLATEQVDAQLFQQILDRRDEEGTAYDRIKTSLREFKHGDPDIGALYTMRKTDKPGILEFVVDIYETEDFNKNGMIDPDEEKAHVGERYNASILSPVMLKGFDVPVAESSVTHDKWGDALSAYAPIRLPDGGVVGIIGADFDARILRSLKASVQRATLIAFLAASVLWLLLAWHFGNRITRPINSLKAGLDEISSGKQDVKVLVSSKDEFGLLASALNDMSTAIRERELYYNVLKRYVSPSVAEEIVKNDKSSFLVPSRRRVTILFADLWNFTPFSEKMRPEDVVSVLNVFFSKMVEIIYSHHGTLDKFLGDGLMAMFGAPFEMSDHEFHAVSAAWEMNEVVKKLQNSEEMLKITSADAPITHNFRIGIGINTGPVVVGSIGSDKRTEYTAIGDEVNLASRIQTATRLLNAEILISPSTMSAVKHDFSLEHHENIQMKGISKPVTLYSVTGKREDKGEKA